MSKQFILTPKLLEAIRTVKVPSKHYDYEIAPTFPEFLYLYGKYMKMPWLQKEALHLYLHLTQMEEEPWEWLQIVGLLGKSGQIVKKGREYIQQVLEKAGEGNWSIAEFEEDFEEMWRSYPKSDAHGHFKPSGLKRQNKAKCRRLAYSLWCEGEDLQSITELIIIEVEQRKKDSTHNNNKLKYLQKLENYLRDRSWEIVKDSVSLHSNSFNTHGKDIS